jgi:methionyl-tRNA formyltransferase
MTAVQIKNLVRGLNPIMGAYAYLDSRKIKIWKAQAIDEKIFEQQVNISTKKQNNENGRVLISDCKEGLYIKTKDGKTIIVAEGTNINDFINSENFTTKLLTENESIKFEENVNYIAKQM